jgi:hypothetical protein
MKTESNGKWQLPLFAANGKRKWQTSVCLLQTEMENQKYVFLGQEMKNNNQQLMFQQTCPSMVISL